MADSLVPPKPKPGLPGGAGIPPEQVQQKRPCLPSDYSVQWQLLHSLQPALQGAIFQWKLKQ